MLFFPKMYQKTIHQLNYEKLYQLGIRTLLFDLDNTIGTLKEQEASKEVQKLFQKLSKKFHIAIVSNHSSKKRVERFAKGLHCKAFFLAMKPSRRILRKAKKLFHSKPEEICMIGDQLLTDILVANRFGCYSCLVEPLAQKDLKITSLNRILEYFIFKRYERKNIMKKGEYYE